jgi:hypothetical protein
VGGSFFLMEPMAGLEPATYALRRSEAENGATIEDDSDSAEDPDLATSKIFPDLSETFRIFLNLSRSACYAGATQPVTPAEYTGESPSPDRRRKMPPP